MNARDRFLNCIRFVECDRPPRWEWGFRADTTERWRNEGLPPSVPDEVSWTDYFGLDRGGGYANGSMAERVGVNVHLLPDFSGEVLHEDDRTVTRRNGWGAVTKGSKVSVSIPQYISFGVETHADFQKYRECWDPHDPARYPEDWEARKARWRARDYPTAIWTFGWYGVLRELMGVEGLSVALASCAARTDPVAATRTPPSARRTIVLDPFIVFLPQLSLTSANHVRETRRTPSGADIVASARSDGKREPAGRSGFGQDVNGVTLSTSMNSPSSRRSAAAYLTSTSRWAFTL